MIPAHAVDCASVDAKAVTMERAEDVTADEEMPETATERGIGKAEEETANTQTGEGSVTAADKRLTGIATGAGIGIASEEDPAAMAIKERTGTARDERTQKRLTG